MGMMLGHAACETMIFSFGKSFATLRTGVGDPYGQIVADHRGEIAAERDGHRKVELLTFFVEWIKPPVVRIHRVERRAGFNRSADIAFDFRSPLYFRDTTLDIA